MLLENNSFPEDNRVMLEAETLVSAGFDVTVISQSGKSRKFAETIAGVHVYRYPPPHSSLMAYSVTPGSTDTASQCFFCSPCSC